MNKKYLILLIISCLICVLGIAAAKSNKNQVIDINDVPEQEGLYDIKGHPELKLKVFVYRVKPTPNPIVPSYECKIPDPGSDVLVAGAGWTIPNNWTYRLNLSSVPSSVGSDNLISIAENAYSAWEKVTDINFIRGENTNVNRAKRDNQNIITWGTAPSSALAVSYIWYSNGVALEVDTIMNKRFKWYWSKGSSSCAYLNVYDAQNILTHELGHTIGLDDEYTNDYINHTMYGYGSTGEVKKNTLTNGDSQGAINLYNK